MNARRNLKKKVQPPNLPISRHVITLEWRPRCALIPVVWVDFPPFSFLHLVRYTTRTEPQTLAHACPPTEFF